MSEQAIHRDTTKSSTDKDIGPFTEDVTDKTSVISSNDSLQLPEHLRVAIAETHYPPTLLKIGNALKSTILIIIHPFLKLIQFLQRRTNLTFWIVTGMVVGILIGRFSPAGGVAIKPLGTAFIRMIQIIVVPLVFSVLVIGIAGHGDDIKAVGFLAIKTLIVRIPQKENRYLTLY
jgi:proton glutamate symport protein